MPNVIIDREIQTLLCKFLGTFLLGGCNYFLCPGDVLATSQRTNLPTGYLLLVNVHSLIYITVVKELEGEGGKNMCLEMVIEDKSHNVWRCHPAHPYTT